MKKKAFLSLFAILALLCSQLLLTGASEMPVVTEPTGSPAVTAPAEEEPAPAQPEAPLFTYILQDGGVILTGYNGNDVLLLIPEQVDGLPVVGIASLGSAPTVRELRIPDGVRFLGAGAFDGCTALEVVHLGSGVSYIDPALFLSCPNLIGILVDEDNDTYRDIDGVVYNEEGDTLVAYPIGRKTAYDLPQGVSNIAALDQPAYQNVVLNADNEDYTTVDGVTYTADMTTVVSCDQSKAGAYVMPDTVTTIQPRAFVECAGLTSVTISPRVTEITYAAFADCSALQSVDIPDSVVTIGGCSFGGCTALEQVEIPGSVETLEGSAFQRSGLTSVVIPDSVKTIGGSCFAFTPLNSVHIGTGVEEIGWSAFENCDALPSVVIPDNVTVLGSYGFANCTSLSSVTLGTGLTAIQQGTFRGCPALASIEIPANITSIGDSAFQDSGLTSIDIPGTVKTIGEWAFYGCPLETLAVGDGLEQIGECAFADTDIGALSLPDSVTTIVYGAFLGSEELSTVDLPDTALRLDGHVFDGTAWFQSQPDGPVYADRTLYRYKGEITEPTEVKVQPGTLSIANYAFENADYTHVPEGPYESIYSALTYYKLSGLTKVTLPDGLIRIGEYAFFDCGNLNTINIPDTVESIGSYAFAGTGLTSMEIPASVTALDTSAFVGCTSLEAIHVAEDNPIYSSINGVLYNKEKTQILYVPEANDQMQPESISVTPPYNTYYYGNTTELDTEGMCVYAQYAGGYRQQVYSYSLSPFDPYTLGEQEIDVTFGGQTASFTVTVEAVPEESGQFVIDSVSGWNGDTVTLTVRAENNPGVASVRHTLTFDPAVFQYVSCELAEGLPGFREVNEEQAAAGQITIVWVNAADYQGDIFYTLTLEIADTAQAGSYTIGMDFGERDNMNAALQPVAFTPASGTVEVKNYTAGDLTGDGEPSMDDALLLAQVLSGQSIVLTDEQEKAADLNGDGLLDLADVILLAQMLAAQE